MIDSTLNFEVILCTKSNNSCEKSKYQIGSNGTRVLLVLFYV